MLISWLQPIVDWFGLETFANLMLLCIVILLIIKLVKGD